MTDQPIDSGITGGQVPSGLPAAPLGKRALADMMDLILVPAILGAVFGLILVAAGDTLRDIVLGLVYVAWLLVRDLIFSPGRKLAGLKLIGTEVGAGTVNLKQVAIRNVLLLPFILIVGYVVETVFLFWKHERLMDPIAKTRVVAVS